LNDSQSTTFSTSQALDEPDEGEDSGEEVLEKSQDALVCRFSLSDTFLLTKLQVPPKTPAQVSGRKCAASATPVSNIKKSHITPAEKLFTGISTSTVWNMLAKFFQPHFLPLPTHSPLLQFANKPLSRMR